MTRMIVCFDIPTDNLELAYLTLLSYMSILPSEAAWEVSDEYYNGSELGDPSELHKAANTESAQVAMQMITRTE